jgi:hypothetical protein
MTAASPRRTGSVTRESLSLVLERFFSVILYIVVETSYPYRRVPHYRFSSLIELSFSRETVVR